MWYTGLVALQHVGSSRTRARTCVPCIGRRILSHCTTREVPTSSILTCDWSLSNAKLVEDLPLSQMNLALSSLFHLLATLRVYILCLDSRSSLEREEPPRDPAYNSYTLLHWAVLRTVIIGPVSPS